MWNWFSGDNFRWEGVLGSSFLGDRDFPDTYNNVSKTVDFWKSVKKENRFLVFLEQGKKYGFQKLNKKSFWKKRASLVILEKSFCPR